MIEETPLMPQEILEESLQAAQAANKSFIVTDNLREKIEFICRCNANKAPIRFLMSCVLAKIDDPSRDIRKPYTEIEGKDSYSGRFYDERYVEAFVHKYKLPCNPTTAYLTPAFRNLNRLLTTDLVLQGRPLQVYKYALEVLAEIHLGQQMSKDILQEIIRFLLIIKKQNESRMEQLIAELRQEGDVLPLSSEQIVTLLDQHLKSKNASRLPVLIVAGAYEALNKKIGEVCLPLEAHNAADSQTGSFGDIEVTLENDDKIVTCYEMKDKRVSKNDIDVALQKIARTYNNIDNYIFITTDIIELTVEDYAKTIYEQTGVEFAILDCVGFIKHFLHFFHRHRQVFLDTYQKLVLAEPSSSVSQPLKEVFLSLRRAAEAG